MEHSVNGYIAESPEQWAYALRTLCANTALRARLRAAGRRRVEQHYSLQTVARQSVEI